jgi:predicted ATPase
MRYNHLRGALAEALGRAGEVAAGQAMIDAALAHGEAHREGWCLPELLRIKGELLLMEGGESAISAAEQHLVRAIRLARRHEALSWELRAATSLARLRSHQQRRENARDLLGAVYGRFSEGFANADLRGASRLLDALA